MRQRRWLALCAALVSIAAGAQVRDAAAPRAPEQALVASPDPALAANKKLALDFYRDVVLGGDAARARQLLADDYVEIEPTGRVGREEAIAALERAGRRPVAAPVEDLVTVIAEGDRVVLGFRRRLPDPANEGQTLSTSWFELVRVADGKIVERWSDGARP